MTKLYCSFCGKSQDEVEKLIAGPTVHVCGECVDLCHDILHPGAAPPPAPPQHAHLDPLLGEIRSLLRTVENRLADIQLRLLEERPRPGTPKLFGQIIGFGEALRDEPEEPL